MTLSRRSLIWLPALALARCASPPPPPGVVELTIHGSADQNPDAAGHPAPVVVRLYQLTGTGKFSSADVFALSEREHATLGEDEMGSDQADVAPGQTVTKTIALKPGVQALGVVVLFRDIDRAQWRQTSPVAASGPTKLTLTLAGVRATLAPA